MSPFYHIHFTQDPNCSIENSYKGTFIVCHCLPLFTIACCRFHHRKTNFRMAATLKPKLKKTKICKTNLTHFFFSLTNGGSNRINRSEMLMIITCDKRVRFILSVLFFFFFPFLPKMREKRRNLFYYMHYRNFNWQKWFYSYTSMLVYSFKYYVCIFYLLFSSS